ncbi:MAG: helix-turn-helix transcriptional regulator [Petrimonas mucosa]|jgi:transcriptional regulator with XRE-family HTH domain
MEFIDRLKLFIKSQGMGQTKFEEMVGFSRGYISKLKSSIGAEKLSNIVKVFPNLNLDWLIMEKGEMLNTSCPSNLNSQTADIMDKERTEYKNRYFEILEENRMLRLEIEKLRNGPGADINSLQQ